MSKIKINYFCTSPIKETNAYSQIYLAEPKKNFLEKFGQLGILINIHFKEAKKQNRSWAEDWSRELIDLIKSDFYSPLKLPAEIVENFEQLLQKVNSWLLQKRTEKAGFFEENINELNVCVILLKDNDIYFSQIGGIESLLIKEDKFIDLLEGQREQIKFLNIISGNMEEDNSLIFASKNIFDYFSEQKIIQILNQIPTEKISSEIEKLLGSEVSGANFCFLLISNKETFVTPEKNLKISPATKEAILGETKTIKKIDHRKTEIKEKSLEKSLPEPAIIETKKDVKALAPKIETPKSKTEKIIRKTEKIKPPLPNLPIIKTHRPFLSRKLLLIVSMVLAALFIQSVVILAKQQIRSKQIKEYNQSIEIIKNKTDELSSSLIYQDSSKTKQLSNEIKNLLAQLPQKTEEQKKNLELLQEKYLQQMNKVYRLIPLTNLKPLVDLTELDKNIQIGGVTNIGNNFYLFNPTNNYIYLFNIESKKKEIINQTSSNVGYLQKITTLDNDNLIGFDQNKNLVLFSTLDKKLIPLKFNREILPKEIKNLIVYGRRLYTLEPESNQIYRHSKTIDGFGKEEAWIKDRVDITDALDFAIDGSIYILRKNGEIIRLYQGLKTDFNLEEINPTLSLKNNPLEASKNIKLYTNDELKNIYLLDGPSQRFVVISKEGKLLKQYSSPVLDDLKDFVVSRRENRAWLVSGTKIFEISLE